MEKYTTASEKNRGLTRRQLLVLAVLNLVGWMAPPMRMAHAALQEDLELLSHIPQMADHEGPLLVFRDFVADPDVEVEQHIRLQLSQQKALLSTLKKKIGFEKQVSLSVEEMQVRLMFVPQQEKDHAAAYQRYCLAVTDFLFEMAQADNFYSSITSPHKSYPPVPETGISAFLIHRLAKDYQAVCRFTAESGRSVKYKVTGTIFSNHLGAVDLEIEVLGPGQFGLKRKPFTLWQNSSHGLSTLMAIPVEETLHYHLGTATDRQIAETMRQSPPKNLEAARLLAEEWMAVEESVVGGLVERVLDRYGVQHQMKIPAVAGEMNMAISSLHQYRYRERGIQLVQNLGLQETIALYMEDPVHFKDQLLAQEEA